MEATPPRRLGRPLDGADARDRVRQIQALADPDRLQVLSTVAASDASERTASAIASAAGLEETTATDVLAVLRDAGLLSHADDGRWELTADAWARFGRLLVGSPESGAASARVPPAPTTEAVPPVAARIARDLAYRFSSTFSPETVTRYVVDSYRLLAERARIDSFLPSLTTRFATDRLTALATAEGLILRGTPEVLFVCVQNAGRSQMAAAILRHLAGDRVHVRTAGSNPAPTVHRTIAQVLDEIGVPLAAEFPKPLTDEVVMAADVVVTMGCGDACPIYPGRRYMDWEIADPLLLPLAGVREVRDDIRGRVEALIEELRL